MMAWATSVIEGNKQRTEIYFTGTLVTSVMGWVSTVVKVGRQGLGRKRVTQG